MWRVLSRVDRGSKEGGGEASGSRGSEGAGKAMGLEEPSGW